MIGPAGAMNKKCTEAAESAVATRPGAAPAIQAAEDAKKKIVGGQIKVVDRMLQ